MNRRLVMGSPREMGTVGLVAGLAGAYAAVLIMAASILDTVHSESAEAIGVFLGAVSTVFVGIALYVAAVIITGCVAAVISGRLHQIALLRLLGADSRGLRRSVRAATTWVGLMGAVAGVIAGTAATDVTRMVLVDRGTLPDGAYPWGTPYLLLAIAAVTLCATTAGSIGSRRVLEVTPAAAVTGAATADVTTRTTTRLRAALSVTLAVIGSGLLALGMLLGEHRGPDGFLMAFVGSAISATGLLTGARFVIPRLVAALGLLLGHDSTSVIARRNAISDPMRTTRSTVGLVVGVALVTTFASGTAALRTSLTRWDLSPQDRIAADHILSVAAVVMICVVVVSAVIAAVGFVSTMSLTVIQRRREIGLLRALGLTGRQVRAMITKESIALSATAVAAGIGLGLVYGSAGAQSLIGAETPGFVWGLPWSVLLSITVAGIVLVLAASRPPARRAVAVTPVKALRTDA